MNLLIPNQKIPSKQRNLILIGWISLILLVWTLSTSKFLPAPTEILSSMWRLISKNYLLSDFLKSLVLCFKAILFATLISMFLAYLSTFGLFKPIVNFLAKFRFLPTVGLSFLFMKMTSNVDQQKIALLVFGITAFLMDSIISRVASLTDDELNYPRTLKLNEFQILWEVIIVGKLADVIEAVRQNFAMAWTMLAMVENLCKSQGGIGVVLADSNKWFKFEDIYAIQLLILATGLIMDWTLNKAKGFLFPYTLLNNKK